MLRNVQAVGQSTLGQLPEVDRLYVDRSWNIVDGRCMKHDLHIHIFRSGGAFCKSFQSAEGRLRSRLRLSCSMILSLQ